MCVREASLQDSRRRTVQSHFEHLLPRLESGLRPLDLRCGPGGDSRRLPKVIDPGDLRRVDVQASQAATRSINDEVDQGDRPSTNSSVVRLVTRTSSCLKRASGPPVPTDSLSLSLHGARKRLGLRSWVHSDPDLPVQAHARWPGRGERGRVRSGAILLEGRCSRSGVMATSKLALAGSTVPTPSSITGGLAGDSVVAIPQTGSDWLWTADSFLAVTRWRCPGDGTSFGVRRRRWLTSGGTRRPAIPHLAAALVLSATEAWPLDA